MSPTINIPTITRQDTTQDKTTLETKIRDKKTKHTITDKKQDSNKTKDESESVERQRDPLKQRDS
jgi:hypothetical protein